VECLAAFAPLKGFDVGLPISRMEANTKSVDRNLRRIFAEPKCIIVGHLGDGNLQLVVSLGEKTPERTGQVEEAVYRPVLEVFDLGRAWHWPRERRGGRWHAVEGIVQSRPEAVPGQDRSR
jgi:hypothetical protein